MLGSMADDLVGHFEASAAPGDLVDLYHHTYPESAESIYRDRHFEPGTDEDRVYFTNLPSGGSGESDYGSGVVHLRMPRRLVNDWGPDAHGEHYYDADPDDIRPEHFVDPAPQPHEAARRPGRGEKTCACCHGEGSHPDGSECGPCDGSGMMHSNDPDVFCPGQPQPRRRHWRQGSAEGEDEPDYWHVSPHRLPVGTVLQPGIHGRGNFDESDGTHVHMTSSEDRAEQYRYLLWEQGHPEQHMYQVRPHGPVEPDPKDSEAVRTKHPVTVEWSRDPDVTESDWFEPKGGGMTHEASDDTSYRMQHQGPDADDGEGMHEIGSGRVYPADIHQHPDWYGVGSETGSWESWDKVSRSKGWPSRRVTMYRSLPSPHREVNTGDWVTSSAAYAREHGKMTNPDDDWPVVKFEARADQLRNAGDSINEWSYHGPKVNRALVHFSGGKNHRGKGPRGGKSDAALHEHEPPEMYDAYQAQTAEFRRRRKEEREARQKELEAWSTGTKEASVQHEGELDDDEIRRGLHLPDSGGEHPDEDMHAAVDRLWEGVHQIEDPGSTPEGRHSDRNVREMSALMGRYGNAPGKIDYDEDEESPYYEVKHHDERGRPTGWTIRHYSDGPNAEIRHEATPGESHDMFDIGEGTYAEHANPHGWTHPPAKFGHEHLKGILDRWHDDQETGSREYLEGPYGDPRIRRWKRRHLGAAQEPVAEVVTHFAAAEDRGSNPVDDAMRTISEMAIAKGHRPVWTPDDRGDRPSYLSPNIYLSCQDCDPSIHSRVKRLALPQDPAEFRNAMIDDPNIPAWVTRKCRRTKEKARALRAQIDATAEELRGRAREGSRRQQEGDERPYGDYMMRYRTEDLGERKPRHVIETIHPDGSTAGRLTWYGTTGKVYRVETAGPEDDGSQRTPLGNGQDHRRRGIATAMWDWSQEMTPRARHSNDQTNQGTLWAKALGKPRKEPPALSATAATEPDVTVEHRQGNSGGATYPHLHTLTATHPDGTTAELRYMTSKRDGRGAVDSAYVPKGYAQSLGVPLIRAARRLHPGAFVKGLPGLDEDWGEHLPSVSSIHRHLTVKLEPADRDYVHDESVPKAHRAAFLMDLMGRKPSMHWASQRGRASAEERFGDHEFRSPEHTQIAINADPPAAEHVETDPERISVNGGYAYQAPDWEVPLKEGAPVSVNSVRWRTGGSGWTRHQFKDGHPFTAGRREDPVAEVVAHFETPAGERVASESRRFFHGTSGTYSFEPGDLLTPRGSGGGMAHVYYTSHLPSAARHAAWGQPEFPPGHPEHGRGYLDLNADALPGHVYEVQPETADGKKIGRHAEDPDSGLPENLEAYRTKGRLRVLHEVDRETGEPLTGTREASLAGEITAAGEQRPVRVHRGLFFGRGTADEADSLHRDPSGPLLTQHGVGVHWTDDENSAHNFARDLDPEGWAQDYEDGDDQTHSLGMVLHGEVSPEHVVKASDPGWEDYRDANAVLDHDHPEREVPIRDHAPIRVTHVTTTSTDPNGYVREVDHQWGQTHLASVAAPGSDVIAHFAAAGPWMQQKLFHVKPDPTQHEPESRRHNPADPDQHLHWRAENDEDYEPDECEHCGGDLKAERRHAEQHQTWLENQDWHTDWTAEGLPDTLHRGIGVELPDEVHQKVHDESLPVHERARALTDHLLAGGSGSSNLGNFWSAEPDVSKTYAESATRRYARHNDQTPVMFHIRTPEMEHIETDPDQLRHWGVYSYHLAGNREVPIQHQAPLHVTGISWAPPGHGRRIDSTPEHLHEDPAWIHHDLGEGGGIRAQATAEIVAHFDEDDDDEPQGEYEHPEYGNRDEEWGFYHHPRKGWHCHVCQDFHDTPDEVNDHETGHTDWDYEYPRLPAEMHRGVALDDDGTHGRNLHYYRDPAHDRASAARDILHHLGDFGTHWTDDEEQARHYSGVGRGRGAEGHDMNVVVHARKPAREDIETDPWRLSEQGVLGRDYHEDREIPLKAGAGVHVSGISWKYHDEPDSAWRRHDFGDGPQQHTAAVEYGPKPEFQSPPEGASDEERSGHFNEQMRIKHEWDARTLHGISTGAITPEHAKSLGYYFDGSQTDRWGDHTWRPLPHDLYHVTTDLPGVRASGLRTRDELAQTRGGHGLGGGPENTISLTDDHPTAQNILRSVHEFHHVVNGRYTPAQMWEDAKAGVGAPRPFHEDLASYHQSGWKDGDPLPRRLDEVIRGKEVKAGGLVYSPQEMAERHGPGWSPHHESGELAGRDGTKRYNVWERDAGPDLKREHAADFYKNFAAYREWAGGRENPMFFSTDTKAFAAKDPRNFAIVHARPRPGAMGHQVGALGEWRTGTGDAIETHRAERMEDGHLKEAALTSGSEFDPDDPSSYRDPSVLTEGHRSRLNGMQDDEASALDPQSDEHERVWGFRQDRPHERMRFDQGAATQNRDHHDRECAALGHDMSWEHGEGWGKPGYAQEWNGTCRHCGAGMSAGAASSSSHGLGRMARDEPCAGPGTAWQNDLIAERRHNGMQDAVSQFGQEVKDNLDRQWLKDQGLGTEAAMVGAAPPPWEGAGEDRPPVGPWPGGKAFHGTRSILEPGEVLTAAEAERHPAHPLAGGISEGHVHITPHGAEAQYWAEHADSNATHRRMQEIGRTRTFSPGYNQDHAYPPRVYEVEPTGPVEPDPMGEGSSYRTAHPVRVVRQVRPLECYHPDHEGEMHWPEHSHYETLAAGQDDEDDEGHTAALSATASDDDEWEDEEDGDYEEPRSLTRIQPERDEHDYVWPRLRDDETGEEFRDPDEEPRCLNCEGASGTEVRHLPEHGHLPGVQERLDRDKAREDRWDRGEYDRTRYCGVHCEMSHAEDRAHGVGVHHTFGEHEDEHDQPRLLHGEMPQISGPHEAPVGRQSGNYEVRNPSAEHRCHYCRNILPQYRRQASLEVTAMAFDPPGHFEFYNGEGAEDGKPRTSELEDHLRGRDHPHWRQDQDVDRAHADAYENTGTNAQRWQRYHQNLSALHQRAHDRELAGAHEAVEHGADPSYPSEVRQRLESAHEPQWQNESEERRAHQEAVAEHRENGSVDMHGSRVTFDEMEAHLRDAHRIPHDALPEYHLPTYTHGPDTYEHSLQEAHELDHGEMGTYRHDNEWDPNARAHMHGQPLGAWDAESHLVQHHGFDIDDLRRDEPSYSDLERQHAENHERDRHYLTHHLADEMDEEGHVPHHEWGDDDEDRYQNTGVIPGYRGQEAQLGAYHHNPDFGQTQAPGEEPDLGDTAFSYRHRRYMAPPRSVPELTRHLGEEHGATQGQMSKEPSARFLIGLHDQMHSGEGYDRGAGDHQHDVPGHDPVFGALAPGAPEEECPHCGGPAHAGALVFGDYCPGEADESWQDDAGRGLTRPYVPEPTDEDSLRSHMIGHGPRWDNPAAPADWLRQVHDRLHSHGEGVFHQHDLPDAGHDPVLGSRQARELVAHFEDRPAQIVYADVHDQVPALPAAPAGFWPGLQIPEDREGLLEALREMPALVGVLREELFALARRLGDESPLHPSVVDMIWQMAASCRTAQEDMGRLGIASPEGSWEEPPAAPNR
jgi:hypothetical protein